MNIALVGSAPSSVALGPYKDASFKEFQQGKVDAYPPLPHGDENWDIWCCSPGAFGVVPRATRWYEVHRWEPGQPWFSPEYVEFLKNFAGPVYTGGPVPEIKNHVVYPKDEVEAMFSPYFLTSSLSLMFAMAIMEIEDLRRVQPKAEGEKDIIGMWGVDMAAAEEYGYQRAGCQFFILEALRRGISIYIPPESDILRPMPIYGLCEWDHVYIKSTARMRELNGRIQQATNAMQEGQNTVLALKGATDNMTYWINTWTSQYGLPSGTVLTQKPGTGLGAGRAPVAAEVPPMPDHPVTDDQNDHRTASQDQLPGSLTRIG